MSDVARAAAALADGELVVYPTETVYGLAADALDPDAIERAFAAKGRPRDKPLSLAVPTVEAATEHVDADERTVAFMRQFLPGPVTVVCERAAHVPPALVGGGDRVGVRVPDHEVALALLEAFAPITATSANRSGEPSVTRPDELDPAFRESVAAVVDGGVCDGAASTVVDVERGVVHRRGALADEVEAWLAAEE